MFSCKLNESLFIVYWKCRLCGLRHCIHLISSPNESKVPPVLRYVVTSLYVTSRSNALALFHCWLQRQLCIDEGVTPLFFCSMWINHLLFVCSIKLPQYGWQSLGFSVENLHLCLFLCCDSLRARSHTGIVIAKASLNYGLQNHFCDCNRDDLWYRTNVLAHSYVNAMHQFVVI